MSESKTEDGRLSASNLLKQCIADKIAASATGPDGSKLTVLRAFSFGDEFVIVLRNPRTTTVLGKTSDGKLRGRTFVDGGRLEATVVSRGQAEAAWASAKKDSGDAYEHSHRLRRPFRREGGLGRALHEIGILEEPWFGDAELSRKHFQIADEVASALNLDAVLALTKADPAFVGQQYDWLTNTTFARRRDAFLVSYPYALRLLSRHASLVDAAFMRGAPDAEIMVEATLAEDSAAAERVTTPSARARLLAMMEATTEISRIGFDGPANFLKLDLPAERIPRERAEWLAFDELHEIARISASWTGKLRDLMNVPKGEYGKLLDRIKKTRLGQAITTKDGRLSTRAFQIGRSDLTVQATDTLILPMAISVRGHAVREHMIAATDRLIYGDKSLFGVVETVDKYHADNRDFMGAIAAVASRRGISWPAPTEKHFSRGGFDFVWLTTPNELIDEGAPGADRDGMTGLDHCVGGYVVPCMEGRSFILSVRRQTKKGTERLATAEFKFDGRSGVAEIVQISGKSNAEVPEEVERAVEGVRRRLESDAMYSIRHDRQSTVMSLVRSEDDIATVRAGLSRFLPRHLRDCPLDEFFEAVATLASHRSKRKLSACPDAGPLIGSRRPGLRYRIRGQWRSEPHENSARD